MAISVTDHDKHELTALVGRNLRLAREHAGMSQTELGDALGGVHRQQVSGWERGVHEPSRPQLLRMGQILGRTLGWFYDPHLDAEL